MACSRSGDIHLDHRAENIGDFGSGKYYRSEYGDIVKFINIAWIEIIALNIVACAEFVPSLNGLLKIDTNIAAPSHIRQGNLYPNRISATTYSKESGCTVLPIHKSSVDVDTLYGRAMTRFGFKSPEQITFYRKTVDRTYLVDQGYKHEKQSGAFYHLAQTVSSGTPGKSGAMWLDLTFAKSGSGSDVTAEFCIDPDDPVMSSNNIRQQISARIQEIFGT